MKSRNMILVIWMLFALLLVNVLLLTTFGSGDSFYVVPYVQETGK